MNKSQKKNTHLKTWNLWDGVQFQGFFERPEDDKT
jgi:hypothetical protein